MALRAAVFLIFGFVLAQSQAHQGHAPSPKPRQKSKTLAPHRYIISVNALNFKMLLEVKEFEAETWFRRIVSPSLPSQRRRRDIFVEMKALIPSSVGAA